jgi:apolipoprotein N-acyltransferase
MQASPEDISTTQSLLTSSKLYQPDILVLPEGISFPETPLYASSTLLVTASHVHQGDKAYSELTYKTGDGTVLGTYQKMLLMPIGEYLPYISKVLFVFVRTPESNRYTSSGDAKLTPGSDVGSIEWRGLHIGGLICSDIQSPLLYSRIERLSGAGILIQTGNTVWLHGSPLLFKENLAIAKVHAVQNNAYYLAANNMEPSFILSPSGDLLAEGEWRKPSLLSAIIYPE